MDRTWKRNAALSSMLVAAIGPGPFGCSMQPGVVSPVEDAVVAVVMALHAPHGVVVPLYVGAMENVAEEAPLDRARARLADELGTPVHPLTEIEFHAETGGFPAMMGDVPAATISVGRFQWQPNGSLEVVASFVDETGSWRTCSRFALERVQNDWAVIARVNQVEGCQGLVSFEEVRARVLAEECRGLPSISGTCGDWLIINETESLYTGWTHFFDPQTTLLLRSEYYTDALPPGGRLPLDSCDLIAVERFPCNYAAPASR